MNKDQINQICKAVVENPAFAPRDGWTYCNWALDLILQSAFDYQGIRGLRANDICDYLANTKPWRKITLDQLRATNIDVRPVIAAQKNAVGSGHVALVLPWMPWVSSAKFGGQVPMVANVGKRNGIMGVNWAFATMPDFYERVS